VKRVLAAFRLLSPKQHKLGPLRISANYDVPAEGIGDFLDASYIAVEKLRAFGLRDRDFGGAIKVVHREPGERANGRYAPESDESKIFYPQVRGAPDWLWTIVHELAHRVWYKLLSKDAKEVWTVIANSMGKPIPPSAADAITRLVSKHPDRHNLWFFFKKHFGPDLEAFKAWLQTKRVSNEFPTDYSNADPAESFAEVMADTILGRGRIGLRMQRSGSTMKKVLLSLVAPFRNREIFEDSLLEQSDENFLQSQIDLPSVAGPLSKWVADNLAESMIERVERRPHVTLVYGLDRQDQQLIAEAGADYGRPIRVSLGAMNFFDAPDHDVLYIEIVSEGLLGLRRALMKLPHTRSQTHDDYIPHMTVAYLKRGKAARFKGTTPLRAVASRDGFSVIDALGTETFIPTVLEQAAASPILLADR